MLMFLGCFKVFIDRDLYFFVFGEVIFSFVGSDCWLGLRVGVVIEVLLLLLVVFSENKFDWLLFVFGVELLFGCFF